MDREDTHVLFMFTKFEKFYLVNECVWGSGFGKECLGFVLLRPGFEPGSRAREARILGLAILPEHLQSFLKLLIFMVVIELAGALFKFTGCLWFLYSSI